MIVPAIARPSVPPRFRTKLSSWLTLVAHGSGEGQTYFRNEVTTAISRRSTPACTAMRALLYQSAMFHATIFRSKLHGCKVFPTPTPVNIPYPICFPSPEDLSKVEKRPNPTAQIIQPKSMHSLYRPTQWTTSPETVLLTA